jgi:anti-sigma factor RsiW
MEKKNDRDASVDRLIPRTLKGRADAVPDEACLDAETLAAWADGALDAREQARAEAHAADCARCQAMLAAMVRTAPPPSQAAASWWRFPALGWLVPLTVAAMALVIWVAVPNRQPVQVSQGPAEAVEQAPLAGIPAPAAAPLADARATVSGDVQPQSQAANERGVAASAPASADLRERRDVEPLEKNQAAAAPASPAAAEAGPRREAFAASRLSTFANAAEVIVVSSNPSTRFRLLRGGGVQRSADAGATWRTEATGAADTLIAGASPSPSVCWLVGSSGTVVLSTDGRSWRRVAFPEAVDLAFISATDEDNATVTTADGRAFVTADGGRTWSRGQDF